MDLNFIKQKINLKSEIENLFPSNIVVEDILAKGGQGIVYKGQVDGIDAAIKIYYPGQVQLRIKRETEALTKLNSPYIVKLLWNGTITVDGLELQTVATNLVSGVSLADLLKNQTISDNMKNIIAHDISEAIYSMWEERIVHRDLKPDNILITNDNRACVIDLGVARHIEMTPLTATGFTWGTAGYMSPEQTQAVKQLTCKSDIFALGVILVECGMGRHPSLNDQMRLLSMNLHENLPFEMAKWGHIELISRMLNPKPTKRPLPREINNAMKKYVN